MSNIEKLEAEIYSAKRITVEITENYKEKFLALYNNVRVNEKLLHIDNDEGNRVYITCLPDVEQKVIDWLSDAGEVKDIRTVKCYDVFPLEDLDYDKYDGLLILPKSE